jgi:endonuclease YncB( thermonuclease family)
MMETRARRTATRARSLVLAGVLFLLSQPAFAQEKLCGPANARDGDDLVIAGHDIRLHGIDAFEIGQTCTRSDGQTWPCGQEARRKLQELDGGAQVCCERMQKSTTRGRVVMRCVLEGRDIGQAMVRAGLAFDCPHHSRERYKIDEAAAKVAKAGAWAGKFQAPWLWKGSTYCCEADFPREFCP